ncbi:MAG: UvrD-helicase domain-containing protein [Acidimicrobiales bacterium]
MRTYGHIVVDEAQDLSPMQLRMLNRRSLNGSMTIVGDIAQSTGQWAHATWDEILEHLPDRRPPRREELSIGYRLPAPIMDVAARVHDREAAPQLDPPASVREDGAEPTWIAADADALADVVVRTAVDELDELGIGSVAVISPDSMVDAAEALDAAGVDYGRADGHGLESPITLVPVSLVKGLSSMAGGRRPAAILEEVQGARALYVALTRPPSVWRSCTRPLPDVLDARRARPVAVEVAGLTTSFDEVRVLDDVSLRPGRCHGGVAGSERVRQDDPAARHRRPGRGRRRPGAGRRSGADRRRCGRAARAPPGRHGVPGLGAVPPPERGAQRRLRPRWRPARRHDRRVDDALAMVGLAIGLGDRLRHAVRRPAAAGGPGARLAPEPAVLLLDEPFSNLDAALRAQVRTEVHALLVRLGITTIVVTHDQEEAFVLGDEVAVLGRPHRPARRADDDLRTARYAVGRRVRRRDQRRGGTVRSDIRRCVDGARPRSPWTSMTTVRPPSATADRSMCWCGPSSSASTRRVRPPG